MNLNTSYIKDAFQFRYHNLVPNYSREQIRKAVTDIHKLYVNEFIVSSKLPL